VKGLTQYFKELTTIGRNPKLLIPVIGILMIPIMYSGMFLGAFWNPYGHLDQLPVAVVNSDKGAQYEGKPLHIGQDFIDKLKENENFKYSFVSKEQAQQGLKNNDYYMAIEIPADFSQKTSTLTTSTPTPAEIVFMPNESSNFLASQIGNNAVEKMKTELGNEVTKAYTQTVFSQVATLGEGLGKASVGASDIAAGTDTAKNGAIQLEENLGKLASGSATLKQGVVKLTGGSGKLVTGLADLKQGIGSLGAGIGQLAQAGGKLEQGATQSKEGAVKLAAGLAQSATGAAKQEAGAAALAAGLAQYAEAHPELANDTAMQQLLTASKQLADGASVAKQGQDQLATGATQLSVGTSDLAGGLTALASKLNEAGGGTAKLQVGAGQLHDGAVQLDQGLSSLSKGVDGFVSGSQQLDAGAQQMTNGLLKLTDGTGQLSASLADAADKTSGLNGNDKVVDMFANPVQLDVVKVNAVPNYGTGFAPYFISLGLFVGALLLTVVYAVKEPAVKPASGWSWFLSKLLTMVTIGTVQAIIADTILLLGLGMKVQSVPLFVLFSIVTSIAFMALIQLLVASMQNPGRFLAIIILIFQLTSSGGTFPVEMIPGWLQRISDWLPMTHTIRGFKAVISSGDNSALWNQTGIMLIYFAVFGLLSFGYYMLAYRQEYAKTQVQGDGMERSIPA
jgi:putative membrane protein